MAQTENFLFKQFALQIAKSKKNHDFFSAVRATLPHEQYGNFVDQLKKLPIDKTHIMGKNGGKAVEDLDCLQDLDPLNLVLELKWAKSILSRNINVINEFILAKEQFINAFMSDDMERAKKALDYIEREFGQSIWLIKSRIAFLQFTEGLEAQKKYTQDIKDASSYRGIVAFIAHWISIRNEEAVSATRFIADFLGMIKTSYPLPEGYETYLAFHILNEENFPLEQAINILRLDFSRSLIDFYEAFVSISLIICVSEDLQAKTTLKYAVKRITSGIQDRRLLKVCSLLGINEDSLCFAPSAEAINSHTYLLEGRYLEAIKEAEKGVNSNETDLIYIALISLANSMVFNGEESGATLSDKKQSVSKYLIDRISRTLKVGLGGASKEVNDLLKFKMNFFSIPAAYADIICQSLEDFDLLDFAYEVSALKSYTADPLLAFAFRDTDVITKYFETLDEKNKETLPVKYAKALVGDGSMSSSLLSHEAYLKLNGIKFYRTKDFKASLNYGRQLLKNNSPYYKRIAQKIVSFSLLRLGKIEELCNYIVESYLINPSTYADFPIKQLVGELSPEKSVWTEVTGLLALPIVLKIHSKYYSKEIDSYITYALEDFLDSKNIRRPSELINMYANYQRNQLVFFLREICVESTMDTYTEFNGPHDVAAERLKICRILCELDQPNKDEYQEEIKNLIRQEAISKMLVEIEQSRIHVDVVKLREWAKKDLSESFLRYLDFVRHGIKTTNKSLKDDPKAKALDSEKESLHFMTVPENEVNALFAQIVSEIRDGFASNPDFGLERFVSTRIRHGIIETRLRRPLESHNLITKREKENGPYKSNDYWLSRLGLSDQIGRRLDQAFARFSASYDQLLRNIKAEWLQVRKRTEDKGLFNFLISEGEIKILSDQLTEQSTFRELFEFVMRMLNEKLTISLNEIRNQFIKSGKKEALDLINKLQRSILTIVDLDTYSELEAEINIARTDLQSVFDQVIQWFVPSQTVGTTSYDIVVALNVAEAIVKESSDNFSSKINFKNGDASIEVTGGLPSFIDIFVNIFENVVKRSGLLIPQADIEIEAPNFEEKAGLVKIAVINELGDDIDIDTRKGDLIRRKSLLEKEDYKKAVIKETGSGLYKINRSLKDFKIVGSPIDPFLDFGIEKGKYFISIGIPYLLIDDQTSSNENSIG